MRKSGLFWLLLLCLGTAVKAQQVFDIRGEVRDSVGNALQGATLKVVYGKDSALAISNKDGVYTISKINTSSFTLTASYTGLQRFTQTYTTANSAATFRVPIIQLFPASGQMEGIVIQSVRPVIIKEDTIEYDASAYKVREGAPVEDVIKKLPGVTVDKDGNITAQGKQVARVRVNGKDFFGGDVQTATQNLPADIIQNLQIIDDYGDQANLSGVKTGDPEKILNINTQPNKNKGNFGNATVAGGNEGRYAGNLFANNFHEERQTSVLAAINNTNANLFNFNGGGRGGGARGANFGSDSRTGTGGSGITLSKSVGVNFRDKLGKKISIYGSYSLSDRNTNLISTSFSQDINPLSIRNTQRQSTSHNNSTNHRATFNLEYAIDSFNYIKASPYLSYSKSNNESFSSSAISLANYYTLNNSHVLSNNHSPNGGGTFLYNHRFQKKGRNFSTSVTVDYSDNNSDRYTNGTYHNIDSSQVPYLVKDTLQIQDIASESRNTRTNLHMSYMEPLNQTGTTVLEFNYDWNKSATESIRDVTDFVDSIDKAGHFNDRQSNHYDYQFITNRAGLSLRGRTDKYNYSVGFLAQPATLSGQSIGKNYSTSYHNINWVPSARFVYNFARNNSLTATIDGSAREPNFAQLQPVTDSSSLTNIVVGNPNLQSEFTNTFAVRYNKFDSKVGSSLFINFSFDQTNNKIVSSRFTNHAVAGTSSAYQTAITTTYQNTDGFYGYNGNASYNMPFSNRKYVAGVSFAGNYDNNISFTNGLKNNGNNWNLHPGANFRLDLENKVDLMVRADYTTYHTTTRYDTITTTTKAQTLNYGINGKNYFGDFTIGYDFSKVINYNFNSSVASNPEILNLYAEYRFLKGKKMTVRLQGFDLFNQNSGITRTVNGTNITDSRTNRLGRYFLLSVNIRLAKFAAGMNRGGNFRERNGGGGNGGGGGMRGRNF